MADDDGDDTEQGVVGRALPGARSMGTRWRRQRLCLRWAWGHLSPQQGLARQAEPPPPPHPAPAAALL